MVLRKPYAFLIKYFKLIHLVITFLGIYSVYLINDTLRYINTYFKTSVGKANALLHVHNLAIVLIILSLIIVGIIIWLMKYKNKPRMIYWFYIIGYVFSLVIAFISFSELKSIYTADATLRGIKAVRDLLKISVWIQYYFIVCMLIRGLGFDIKRFNFRSDLEEFNIDKQDSEEVEVTFGNNNGFLQRKGRRTLRELKYYYSENKYMINIFIIFLVAGIVFWVITDRVVTNVVYSEGDSASSGKFTIGVSSSYITNLSSTGKEIFDNGYKLVIVRFSANTNNDYKYKLNTNYLVLQIGNKQFTSTNKYNNYFTDMGTVYKNQNITNNKKYFIMVYVVGSNYINKNMSFKYLGSLNSGKDLTFNIDPVNFGDDKVISTAKLNGELKFNKSLLENTSLKISSYDIQEKYEYNYCYLDNCNNSAIIDSLGNNILKLDINSKIDDTINIDKNWNDIINSYMNVYYVIDDNTYRSVIHYSKTPNEIEDAIYMEVDKDIVNASQIWLEFNIRNQIYKYILKEN